MREPYETLLGHYHGHWLLDQYLTGSIPDFSKLYADVNFKSLSSGEQKMIRIGLAIYNGDREARIADLAGLDKYHMIKVLSSLYLCSIPTLGRYGDELNSAISEGFERSQHGPQS